MAASDIKGFGSVVARAPRLSDRVAETLLGEIIARDLKPGEHLPSERELGEQFGVSRTVIREAVRALAAKGVVESQAGSGLVVAAVGADSVSASMSLYLRGAEVPYAKVHEVRSTIEIEVAGVAAERATEAEISELREACELLPAAVDDVEAASAADVEFHRVLARLTQNELYLIMLDSIQDVLLEIRRKTMGLPNDAARGYREHAEILKQVVRHDRGGAREAMRRHLENADVTWKRLGPVPLHGTGRQRQV